MPLAKRFQGKYMSTRNLLDPSPLGIVVDKVDLADGAQIGSAETYKVNETYPWFGAHTPAVNNCNGAKVALTHPKSSTSYTLEIRAYNDGVAFRHLVPGTGARTPDEVTEFHVPARERDRAAERRLRLRRGLSVADDGEHDREHDGRRVDAAPVHLRAAEQGRVRLHHRGRAGQLQRHDVPVGCRPCDPRPAGARGADDLLLRLAAPRRTFRVSPLRRWSTAPSPRPGGS